MQWKLNFTCLVLIQGDSMWRFENDSLDAGLKASFHRGVANHISVLSLYFIFYIQCIHICLVLKSDSYLNSSSSLWQVSSAMYIATYSTLDPIDLEILLPCVKQDSNFILKIWYNWQMSIITQIHTSWQEIWCPEISMILPSEFYHIWIFHHTRICLLNVKCTLGTYH